MFYKILRNISENFKKHFKRFRVKFWNILSNRHFGNFREVFWKIWENLEILQKFSCFPCLLLHSGMTQMVPVTLF